MPQPTTTPPFKNPFTTIFLAGFTAGILDITAACIQYYSRTGKGPGNILRYVASGVFDKEAFAGGTAMAAWGLLFHFVAAFGATIVFFWLYPKINLLRKNKLFTGLVYGLFVWTVMNLIVVPLSNVPSKGKLWAMATGTDGKSHPVLQLPADPTQMIIGIVIILFCIGLPISLIVSRYYDGKKRL
jgi:hypothetical protein